MKVNVWYRGLLAVWPPKVYTKSSVSNIAAFKLICLSVKLRMIGNTPSMIKIREMRPAKMSFLRLEFWV